MRMKESDLYIPVRDWLVARGYVIHVEIFDADIVAIKEGRLVTVDLKICNSSVLFGQLLNRAGWADEVWAAIGTEPRDSRFGGYRQQGFGLLQVVDGKVRQRVKPRPQPWWFYKRRAYRMKILERRTPAMSHEIAGIPSCPALKMQRLARNAGEVSSCQP